MHGEEGALIVEGDTVAAVEFWEIEGHGVGNLIESRKARNAVIVVPPSIEKVYIKIFPYRHGSFEEKAFIYFGESALAQKLKSGDLQYREINERNALPLQEFEEFTLQGIFGSLFFWSRFLWVLFRFVFFCFTFFNGFH